MPRIGWGNRDRSRVNGSMDRREFLVTAASGSVVVATTSLTLAQQEAAAEDSHLRCDTFVYGSTPSGIAAAVEAARRGERVVLACPKRNPGGMAASGLCTTDAVRKHLFGGFVLEFVDGVRERYQRVLGGNKKELALTHGGWRYEPSVAEGVFREMLQKEDRIDWRPGCWLEECRV